MKSPLFTVEICEAAFRLLLGDVHAAACGIKSGHAAPVTPAFADCVRLTGEFRAWKRGKPVWYGPGSIWKDEGFSLGIRVLLRRPGRLLLTERDLQTIIASLRNVPEGLPGTGRIRGSLREAEGT